LPAANPADAEAALAAHWNLIPDHQERLALATQSLTGPGLPDDRKTDDALVPGCVSRVWLCADLVDGRITLAWDAESNLVRGLAGIICAVYQQAEPALAAAHTTQILTTLGFDRQLSPTRLHGMNALAARIRLLAAPASP
jgi:cysteine desulfuration protein SufE